MNTMNTLKPMLAIAMVASSSAAMFASVSPDSTLDHTIQVEVEKDIQEVRELLASLTKTLEREFSQFDQIRVKNGKVEFLTGSASFADSTGEESLAIEIIIDEEEEDLPKESDVQVGHWNGFSLGTTMVTDGALLPGLTGAVTSDHPFDMSNAFRSWNLGFNFWDHRQTLLTDYIGITFGLGVDWTRLNVDPQHVLVQTEDAIEVLPSDPQFVVKKNHVQSVYLRVPVMLSLRTEPACDEGLHLEAGVVGGVRIGGGYVREYVETDNASNEYADKKGGFGLSPFQVNGRLTVGYESVSAFTEFSLRPMFDQNVSTPKVYPLTFGLIFSTYD